MSRPWEKIARLTYIALFTATVCISVYLIATANKTSPIERSLESALPFDTCWVLSDGTPVGDPARLNLLPGASASSESSIYATLPRQLPSGMSLCFRVKHLYINVYIDGNMVYAQDLPENPFYTNSVGVTWVFIPLGPEDGGKTVELRYKVCYENSTCGIDYLQIASERGFILNLISDRMFAYIMAVIYLTLACILIVVDIPIAKKMNSSHEFLYLGLITLLAAVYCIVETQLFQLFIGNERIMHFLTCSSLILLPMPIVLYTNSLFNFRNKYIIPVFSAVYVAFYVVLGILNYTDAADYHDTLRITHSMLLISFIILFGTITRYVFKAVKTRVADVYVIFEIIGLSLLLAASLIDVVRYYFSNTTDPAKYIRVGLLGFVLCYAMASSQKLMSALKLSAEAELMSKLAYQDSLTGLYNRSAYDKKLEELAASGESVGICAFDVNDLKKTNDSLGHEAGDELLKQSARLINDAFAPRNGICYRIGGDEFIALIIGKNTEKDMQLSLDLFDSLCRELNARGEFPFQVSVAKGSLVYDGTSSLESVLRETDKLMYADKRNTKNDPEAYHTV